MSKSSATIIVAGLALGGLLLAGSPAGAQDLSPSSIGQRQANQQQRIQNGIDSGALTRGETRFLNREQARIERARDRMQADGNLSPQERQRLNRMQNRASDDIYRLKHNGRTMNGWSGYAHPAGGGGYSVSGTNAYTTLGGYPVMGGYPSFGGGGYSDLGSNILSVLSGAFSAFGGYPAMGGGYSAFAGGGYPSWTIINNCSVWSGSYPVWGSNPHSAWGSGYPGWRGRYAFGGDGHYPYWGNGFYNRFERRQAFQQERIRQGIESGELTRGEARYLNREQARIARAEERMMADGRLDPWERQRLNQMQNQASRDVYRLEHNNQTAAGWQGNNQHYAGNQPGGNTNNRGWHGDGNSGWQGNNPGNQAGGNPNNRGWHGDGNSGWHGNNPGGNGNAPGGPAPVAPGNNGATAARNPQGPQGHYAPQGQPGQYPQPGFQAGARPGQAPAFQGRQPQPQYQQQARQPIPQQPGMRPMPQQPVMRPMPQQPAMRPMPQAQPNMRAAMPQTAMRPNANMMARPPMRAGMPNRPSFPMGGFVGAQRR